MKKFLLIGCILFLILACCGSVIGGGYFIYTKLRNNVQAKLQVDRGTVSITHDGSSTSVTDATDLYAGDEVSTSEDSEATIVYANNTVTRLNVNTTVQITKLEDGGNTIDLNLLTGEIWNRVQKVVGNGSYTVESNGVVAAVRGTAFNFRAAKDGDEFAHYIAVVRGKVGVIPSAGKQEEGVDAGAVGVIDRARKFAVRKLSSDLLDSAWQKLNEGRDTELDALIAKGKSLFDSIISRRLNYGNDGLLGNPLSGLNFDSNARWSLQSARDICANAPEVEAALGTILSAGDFAFGSKTQAFKDLFNTYISACKDGTMSESEFNTFQSALRPLSAN